MTPRPSSLSQVAERSLNGLPFEYELADFLHQFAYEAKASMLAESPVLLSGKVERGAIFDAYLAAVAVSLAGRLSVPAPVWARHADRILPEPWFASPGRHMRALLLVESPAAFRERNLFVTANALSVA